MKEKLFFSMVIIILICLTNQSTVKIDDGKSESSEKTDSQKEEDIKIKEKEDLERIRNEYSYWIKFKNSFTFDSNQKAKLARSFKPEESNYISKSINYGWMMFILASIFGALLLMYLILRLGFKKFQGPKSHISSWYSRISYIFIFVGFMCSMIFFSLSLRSELKTNNSLNNLIVESKTRYGSDIKKIETLSVLSPEIKKELKTDLEGIISNIGLFEQNYLNFNYIVKNSYISIVAIVPILVLIALFGFFIKKEQFILPVSIILFALICPCFILIGYNMGHFLMYIDYCSEVLKYSTNDIQPIRGKGIGKYTSCVSKDNQISLASLRYELNLSPQPDKEINTSIDSLLNCNSFKEHINYSEVNFCHNAIGDEFHTMKFFFLGLLFLIPLSIGINRLVVIVSPLFDQKKVIFLI